MSKRPRGRPFPKGKSANPGGRPKTPLTIEAQRIKADVKALTSATANAGYPSAPKG